MCIRDSTLAAAAIAALGYGIYKLITYQTDAEKAREKLNNAISESEKVIGAERLQIDAMFARLKAAKEGTDEYLSLIHIFEVFIIFNVFTQCR